MLLDRRFDRVRYVVLYTRTLFATFLILYVAESGRFYLPSATETLLSAAFNKMDERGNG